MVGAAIVRAYRDEPLGLIVASRDELDLTDPLATDKFFARRRPNQVIVAAAKVGGIHANSTYPADFIDINLMIAANVIRSAHRHGVERLLFLGSSCIYPKLAPQPIPEDALLNGDLEPTNDAYAIAKIAGIKLCEAYRRQYGSDFRSIMPTNLYGTGDNFHPQNSHVVPALIRRFEEARLANAPTVTVWGSGKPLREFLHVDDLAAACRHVMLIDESDWWGAVDAHCSHLNVGSGEEVTIAELAQAVGAAVGFEGDIVFDTGKPDGTPRKLMDSARLRALGWAPRIGLLDGLKSTVEWWRSTNGAS
ncbi:MAG: GDP-L-fucose synthase [Lysobacteraceae bacterium]|nr:MAG: GDP-L-fucose synthase [Xanthomonadaceae bacterium]